MRTWWKTTALCLTALCVMAMGVNDVLCQVLKANIAQLTNLSADIVVGRVVEVTDGIASDNLPHTEITLLIDETLKGTLSGTYIFWQFGLIKPREMGNGMVNLNVTPAGWARYAKGEEVILFLNKQAAQTGLRSPVGQFQGKFLITGSIVKNGANNLGLFEGVSVPNDQLTSAERAMLRRTKGPFDAATFIAFIRKAIEQNWFAGAG